MLPAVDVQSLNHWTTSDVPSWLFLNNNYKLTGYELTIVQGVESASGPRVCNKQLCVQSIPMTQVLTRLIRSDAGKTVTLWVHDD